MDSNDIETIKKSFTNVQKEIMSYMKPDQDFDKVIILGLTGAGKTTVSSLISHKKVMIKRFGKSKAVLECAGIKGGCKSVTTTPNVMVDLKSKIIIADCPGFQDTKGLNQEIINAFAIDYLLDSITNKKNRLKILLVVSSGEIEATRAQLVLQNFERIEEMFPNRSELEKGIGIVFTKTDQDADPIDLIDELSYESEKVVEDWCNFFKENPEKIFILPKPLKEDIDKEYEFDDKERLVDFIKKDQIDPNHVIALSKDAKIILNQVRLKRNKHTDKRMSKMFDTIEGLFRNETDLVELNKWSAMLQKFMQDEVKGVNDLIAMIQAHLPNSGVFSEYVDDLKDFEVFDSFLNKIFPGKTTKISQKFKERAAASFISFENILKKVQQIEMKNKQLESQGKLLTNVQEQLAEAKESHANDKLEMQKKMEEQKEAMQHEIEQQQKKMEEQKEAMQHEIEQQQKKMEEQKEVMQHEIEQQQKKMEEQKEVMQHEIEQQQKKMEEQKEAMQFEIEQQQKQMEEQKEAMEEQKIEMEREMRNQKRRMQLQIDLQKMSMQQIIDKQKEEIEEKINEHEKYINKIKDLDITIKKPLPKEIDSDISWKCFYVGKGCVLKNKLKGILSYLTEETNGNIHKNNTIQIVSNSIKNSNCMPENVVNFTDLDYYQNKCQSGSYIIFDFLDYEVQVDGYLIKTASDSRMKNWVLEGSNDYSSWKIIDSRNNCGGLNVDDTVKGKICCIFVLGNHDETFYRYIRLRQTGYNWNDTFQMKIIFIELYGKLHPL